jgi:hypothetical protein
MARGRDKSEWARTASIMSLLANINRDAKKKPTPFTPADFMPGEKPKPVRVIVPLTVLRDVFVPKK